MVLAVVDDLPFSSKIVGGGSAGEAVTFVRNSGAVNRRALIPVPRLVLIDLDRDTLNSSKPCDDPCDVGAQRRIAAFGRTPMWIACVPREAGADQSDGDRHSSRRCRPFSVQPSLKAAMMGSPPRLDDWQSAYDLRTFAARR